MRYSNTPGDGFGIDWQNATIEDVKDLDMTATDGVGRSPVHYAIKFSKDPNFIDEMMKIYGDLRFERLRKIKTISHSTVQ